MTQVLLLQKMKAIKMKLFIVHAGFYDAEVGIYELHTNFLVAAEDAMAVKKRVMEKEIFKSKNMHIDAVQEINTVDGYQVTLQKDVTENTICISYDYTQMKNLAAS